MLKQGRGAIVNTSSGAGVKGIAGQAAYCAAKFGIIGLTKAAALDLWARNFSRPVLAYSYNRRTTQLSRETSKHPLFVNWNRSR